MNAEQENAANASAKDKQQKQEKQQIDASALIGRTVGGRYELRKKIGRGGMGVVFLARQSNLSRNVVVKLLAPNLLDDQNALARFEREARGLSRLQHPNIVTIFDFGRDDDQAFIAMEYVDGHTLSRLMRRTGPLSLEQFAPIAIQILKGIGEAHKLGLVHRDIKPTNIMLCELEGQPNFVKILDFGLAKLVANPTEVTKEQHLVGSAAFLSPEQILNNVSNPTSDVYALGVLFYLMLSGKRPFKADNDAVLLYKHVNEEPPPLDRRLPDGHDIPPAVVRVVESCLRKDPEDRPKDANELLARLSDCLATSMNSVPWMSGEFSPVPSGGRALQLGSPETNRALGVGAEIASPGDDTNPPDYENADTGSPLELTGSLAGQSVIMVAPDDGRRNLIITAVVVTLIAAIAVGVTLIVLNDKGSAPTVAEDDGPDVERLTGVLDTVETLIDDGKWGRAEEMLNSVADDLSAAPELVERGAEYRDQIAVGRLMATSERLAEDGDIRGAISKLDAVLARDAKHGPARERKEVLLERLADSEHGVLSVASSIDGATVFVDGRKSGTAPISVELPPGTYAVKVTADGYPPLEREVVVEANSTYRIDTNFAAAEDETTASTTGGAAKKKRDGHRAKSSRRDKTEKRSARKDDSSGGDSKSDTSAAKDDGDSTSDEKETAGSDDDGKSKRKSGLLLPVDKDEEEEDDGKKRKKGGLLLPVE